MYLIRNPGIFGLRPSPVGHLKMCLEEPPENIAARKNSFYWVERQERAEANRNRKCVSLHPVWQELKVSALVTPFRLFFCSIIRIRISFIAKFVQTNKEFDSGTLCSFVLFLHYRIYKFTIYNIHISNNNKKVHLQHLYAVVLYSIECSSEKQPGGRNCLCGGWF
ncbi:hypothetical protein XENOCAPTIV_028069 [Xenoophorus captivus]|uniref:Uncharacterized protein n=1 Tax=Xenoophorus captivus TaxID=1517983 RepID=A0ABV0RSH0_9TELE